MTTKNTNNAFVKLMLILMIYLKDRINLKMRNKDN